MLELSDLKKLAEMPTAERAFLSVYLAGTALSTILLDGHPVRFEEVQHGCSIAAFFRIHIRAFVAHVIAGTIVSQISSVDHQFPDITKP